MSIEHLLFFIGVTSELDRPFRPVDLVVLGHDGFMGSGHLQFFDVNRGHEPEKHPANSETTTDGIEKTSVVVSESAGKFLADQNNGVKIIVEN